MKYYYSFLTITFLLLLLLTTLISGEQCGRQAGNALCPNNLCCSQYGWCGTTEDYCGNGCQSQCKTPPSGGSDIGSIITPALFDQMLKYRNDGRCPSNGFYSYNAFITAARSFNGFGTTGDLTFRKREIAAFLAQTSHETTGNFSSNLGLSQIFIFTILKILRSNYKLISYE